MISDENKWVVVVVGSSCKKGVGVGGEGMFLSEEPGQQQKRDGNQKQNQKQRKKVTAITTAMKQHPRHVVGSFLPPSSSPLCVPSPPLFSASLLSY